MNQEDKDLLLKDLCSRLPYGVKVHINSPIEEQNSMELFDANLDGEHIGVGNEKYVFRAIPIIDDEDETKIVKPYLRPMSSMTEEEKINLYKVLGFYYLSNNELLKDEWRWFKDSLKENKLFLPYPIWIDDLQKAFKWLNAHHFDYRGLIEKGFALEAPEDMYKI